MFPTVSPDLISDHVSHCRNVDFLLPSGEWLQPCKVALAVAISSAEVLVDNPSLGLQTIWGPLSEYTRLRHNSKLLAQLFQYSPVSR